MANITMDKSGEASSSGFRSATHKRLEPAWKITADLWGSPLDIRKLEGEYLTKFNKEPAPKYKARLERSLMLNDFRTSIETMAGMVFRKDPKPEGLHDEIDRLMTDIDLCGNSFWAWNQEKFAKFIRDGNGFIVIDAPPLKKDMQDRIDRGEEIRLDERWDDRPWWVYYHASQIINCRYEKRGSETVFTQVTIAETVTLPDGEFGEKEVEQHKILRPGSFEIRRKDEKSGEFVTVPGEGGKTNLDKIMIVPVIKDLATAPPLLTLAMLNILHYNMTSNYDDAAYLVCVPLRVSKFDTKEDADKASQMQIASPGIGLKIWGQHADVKYVEVAGTALERVEARYQDIKREMTSIGVGMLAPSDIIGVRTATEVMDNAGQRQSKLAKLAREWANAVEQALYMTAELINEIKGQKIIDLENAEERTKMSLRVDYDRLTFSVEQLGFFNDMVDSGKLSLRTFLEWLPQVTDMPPGFDPEVELKRLADVNRIETEPDDTDEAAE